MWGNRTRRAVAASVLALALGAASCSSNDDDAARAGESSATTTAPGESTTTTSAPDRSGPVPTYTELTTGTPIPPLTAQPGPDLAAANYSEHEYAASGSATAYQSTGDLPADGKFELAPSTLANYSTRVIVRRPEHESEFNGSVVVEWLNVSSGADAEPDYTYAGEEIVRKGFAYVGVSAQRIGVEGGPVLVPIAANPIAGKGLKGASPERYASLNHPGDAYSYDIFTQVARSARAAAPGSPFDGLKVERVLADGESQSAYMLTTYANGVQPLTNAFDGFLIHSRGASSAPLGKPGEGIDLAGSMGGAPTVIRDDLAVPTMIVETETDVLGVLGYLPARQDDTDRLRLWEVAGTAHADQIQVGPAEPSLGCPVRINNGQQAVVVRAALRHLDEWAAGGAPPPKAKRLDVVGTGPDAKFALDANGNVTGGVRTPVVDAPVEVLSGLAPDGSSIACTIMGSTTPIPASALAELYDGYDDYAEKYEAALDDAVKAGFVLDDDRDEILDRRAPVSDFP